MRELLKLPNLLTLTRLALVPFVVGAIVNSQHTRALALAGAASLTDALDGYLARAFSWSTAVGRVLDPVADKIFLASIYIALCIAGGVPWWLVLLIFGRDALILASTAITMLLTPLRHFPPSIWGKISTFFQMLTAVVVLINRAFPAWRLEEIAATLIWITAGATLWSGIHYSWTGTRRLREARLERASCN
jgi:cardiolipin synthase (CMP-forming)